MEFKAGSSLNYLALKPGESVRGVFRGNPYEFKRHWHSSLNRSETCPGEGCKTCKEGQKPGFRFKINFVMSENGAYIAKVFEQGWNTYLALKGLHESDYDLERTQIKITRNGTGTSTTYTITPLPKGEITDEVEKKLKDVKLNDLTPLIVSEEVKELADADIPF